MSNSKDNAPRRTGGQRKPRAQGSDQRNMPTASVASGKPFIHVPSVVSPRDIMLPYQKKWADDDSRFKIGMMARQVGKDFSSGEEGIRELYQLDMAGSKTDWLIVAPSERQSLESLGKWKEWAEAYKFSIADIQEEREGKGSEAMLKSSTITFPHGGRAIAVPGRPDTVRGFSANVLGTEFAFFEDPDATWRALLPSITNPLRGGKKKARLISTPNGIGNKFHDLWKKNYQVVGANWSCHKITITDAVAQGLPIDIEELRSALDDPEGWAQEYDPLDFLDSAAVLLPYDLIAGCENTLATAAISPEFWQASARNAAPIDLGIDFGRKKDLTVCWSLEAVYNFHMTKEVLCLAKMSTPKQVEILTPRIERARRVCLDYTGPGVGLGDLLVQKFGEYNPEAHKFGKVELCTFTVGLKNEIFPKLRMKFEEKSLGIPISREIREDLHSMYRVTTSGGTVTYKAPHTADGHADRCTALALAVRAASAPGLGYFATMI